MDIKNAFLNDFIEEKVSINNLQVLKTLLNYIMFSNFKRLFMVLNKLLELAMKSWATFFLENGFVKGKVDTTLCRKKNYVDTWCY